MSRRSKASGHIWQFVRMGGLDQVSLESAEDLLALGELDPKLWVALSCPVKGLELDEKTLSLIDTDGDGHIRVSEVLAAVRWAAVRLKEPARLLQGPPALPLAAIQDATPEGRVVLETARRTAARLGRKEADAFSPEDLDPAKVFAVGLTGDGVVPSDATPDAAVRALIGDVMACLGSKKGKAGREGITSEQAEAFFKDVDALAEADAGIPVFLPYPGWTPARPESPVAKLGSARIKELAQGPARAGLAALFARDEELAPEWEALAELDRFVRYHRDLRDLLRNFLNFFDFYSRDHLAAFQAGTLYIDSRSCELCLRVEDPAAHALLAAMSKLYLAYFECRRPESGTIKLAVAVTEGDSDYLYVGRNALFYDRRGREWDASLVKIIDNPISLREAFFSPYKKFLRLVEQQLIQRASTANDAVSAGSVPAAAAKPRFDVGTVAALGVAVGGLSAALSSWAVAVAGHRSLIPVILLGIVAAISGPSVLIAWFKLRQRNLGPVLEANGWAVNGRVKINRPLGDALSERAALPANARRRLSDPYADRAAVARRWIFGVAIALLLAALAAARVEDTWPFAPLSGAPSTPATSTAPSGR